MSDTFFDKFIADLVKGASANKRENGGPGVDIIVSRENRGHEVKLAHNHAGVGAAIGGPIGAAIGADSGHRLQAAGGSMLGTAAGGLGGSAIGALLGTLAGNPGAGAGIGGSLGALAGNIYGGHRGGEPDSMLERARNKISALESRYASGSTAAKLAFLGALAGMAGSVGGGMLARKALPHLTGLAGHAAEMGGQMLGGSVAQHMTQPQQPMM